jgi:hypothetical protein
VGGVDAQVWVALIIGALGIVAALITWWQKNKADRRSEWWRRTTWAFERTFSFNDMEAMLGWKMLSELVSSKLATNDDRDMVRVIAADIESSAAPAVRDAAAWTSLAASKMAGREPDEWVRKMTGSVPGSVS